MFDSHVHFDAGEFAGDLDASAAAAREAGVRGALNPAVDLESSARVLGIHRRHPWILPAFGFHPLYLDPWAAPPVGELERLAAAGPWAAVGEAGLDFWNGRGDEERQRAFLEVQARLARRLGLPLILHVRKAFYEAFAVLREAGFDGPGVCHAFSGSREMARLALDRGFYLSACANLTYPVKGRLREVFRWAPRESLLVETDAPDIPPWTRKGSVHHPKDLPVTVAALAETLGIAPQDVAELTEANARRLLASARIRNPFEVGDG